jgi:hypothetical protein
MAKKLGTQARHQEKIHLVLMFLAVFGIISPMLINQLSNHTKRGFPLVMLKKGLLICRKVSGLIVLGCGVTVIYGLSKQGAALAGVKQKDIHHIGADRLAHVLIAQHFVIHVMDKKRNYAGFPMYLDLIKFEFEPQTTPKDFRPDLILHFFNLLDETELTFHVEIERTRKHTKQLDRFFNKILFSQHDMTIVVFENESDREFYLRRAKALHEQKFLPQWFQANGAWFSDTPRRIPQEAWKRVCFKMAGSNEPLESLAEVFGL